MNVKELEHICDLIYETFEVPVFLLNREKDLLHESFPGFGPNPFYNLKKEMFNQLYPIDEFHDLPVIVTTDFIENYICLTSIVDNLWIGTIIVGPSLFNKLPEEQVYGLLEDTNPFANKNLVMEYYSTLRVLKNVKLLTLCKLLYFMVYQKKLNILDIITARKNSSSLEEQSDNSDLHLIANRKNYLFRHDTNMEMMLFHAIKEGRVDRLTEFLSLTNKNQIGTLSKRSYLRSTKNLAISGITFAAKAAIDGGLYSEIALSVADIYIQKIDGLSTVKEIRGFVMEAFSDFANRVSKSKTKNYSLKVSICQNYINDHIYEPITLNQLAELTGLHPNYLSALIKKEMGLSFSEYLKKTKMEEAKQLLKLTNHSISEIGTMLNYVDQSYFTKIFKKQTGLTPFQYRNKILK